MDDVTLELRCCDVLNGSEPESWFGGHEVLVNGGKLQKVNFQVLTAKLSPVYYSQ